MSDTPANPTTTPQARGIGVALGALTGWQVLMALALILAAGKFLLPAGMIRPPDWMILPFADWINVAFDFVRYELGLLTVTRTIADGIEWCLDVTGNLLYGRNRWPRIGPVPWAVVAVSLTMLGYGLGGWKLAALAGGTMVWIAVMGQWRWSMETLSVILVAAPLSVLIGMTLGIMAWRWKGFERVLNPLLNIAQSLPHFAYMIPVVVFIGVGPKAGAVVTIIFSVPPMIRLTLLGLRKVPEEVVEAGRMCGASQWALLTRVRLPTARTELLIGVNQVIMQCLAMVVLASFIGMPGLGQRLLQMLQALRIGPAFELGITIVLIAITLDRLSKAWAVKKPIHHEPDTLWTQRYRLWLIWGGLVLFAWLLAQIVPYFHEVARNQALSLSRPIDVSVNWFLALIAPVTEALRRFLIIWVLIPFRDSILWLPFTAVLVAVAAIGWALGGRRSALVCLAFIVPIAMSGWWDRAMITVYTVLTAVTIAAIVSLPLGIWGAGSAARARRVLLVCDTMQTFPSFIYLIPVVMLFGVSDVAVLAAVMVFAGVPLVRYTIEGLTSIPPETLEAGQMNGATHWQALRHIRLPLAFPTILIGFNQSVMFALFMVIIAAFIGTQDLGQEMQRALSSTDVGKGLVLGFAVAFLGLMTDHLLLRWAARIHESQIRVT